MRKTIIITLVVLILLLGGAWAYLLLNGAPESIADLGDDLFGGGNTPSVVTPSTEIPIPENDDVAVRTIPMAAPLIQVSTRAVAGAITTETGSSTALRYMEKGTGHVYDVDLESGLETRVSNTTIPGTVRALWSPLGDYVLIETDVSGRSGAYFLGTIRAGAESATIETVPLEGTPGNAAFAESGRSLFYTTVSGEGTTGWSRDLASGATGEVFTIPFTEASVLFDVWDERTHYAFTKPAVGFRGFLYEIGALGLEKIDEGDTLVATRPQRDTLLVTKNGASGAPSLLMRIGTGGASLIGLRTVKEKCTGSASVVWCAAGQSDAATFPIPWYQGLVSYDDTLYALDEGSGGLVGEIPLATLARVPLDVTQLAASGDRLTFINKRDDTLWLVNPELTP